MFNVYQKILSDLESYLDREIKEWYGLARASGDNADTFTLNALTDIRREIERLKRLHLN